MKATQRIAKEGIDHCVAAEVWSPAVGRDSLSFMVF